ncbi:MAG: hypothetical protein QNK05_23170, partial [Myxococcota bacterium]|nr:hypothetical protein [Myxococcota bacterium]
MRRSLLIIWVCLTGSAVALAPGATAHPLAPALLSLDAVPTDAADERVYRVTWKTPLRLPPGVRLEPQLPEACEPRGAAEQGQEGTAWIARFEVVCAGASLAGQEIGVRGLPARGAGAVVRVAASEAPAFQQVVTATAPTVRIPERVSRAAVFRDYAELGTHHLVFGFDHVLFVLG